MSAITLNVNGRTHTVNVDPMTPLLYVLSDDLALNGPKFGCGLGQCGSCTVIAKGQANYYVLSEHSAEVPGEIFCLFTIKCQPVADVVGVQPKQAVGIFLGRGA